jgi:DNA-binding response OmpR family regulator
VANVKNENTPGAEAPPPGDVLLIEDHRDIAEMVFEYLETTGFSVDYADNGLAGLQFASDNAYDAIVLDLMLPGMDGLEVCRELRRTGHLMTPVLMLTARDTLADKLAGFDSGADDYLVKPFDLEELVARLRVLMRRRHLAISEILRVGELSLDLRTLTVTPIGIKILTLLMRESPNIVDRRDIDREIWGDLPPDSDALRSHMYNLRKAIDKPFARSMIRTVHGAGFRICHND